LASFFLAGCGTQHPYFLVESKLIEGHRRVAEPDVTETTTYHAIKNLVGTIGLQPPDVCADQGQTGTGGSGQLQQGILRTRCGVEMAEFERALSRAGYQVVSWGAVQHISRHDETSLLEAAKGLGVEILLQVNSLERIRIQPGRDARFERRFFLATGAGEKADPARVEQSRAREFEWLIKKKEASLANGARVGATINVSAVSVDTGTTIWFYEATEVDKFEVDRQVEVLVDCRDSECVEVSIRTAARARGPVGGSISSISISGDPADQSQAIFHDLVRRLAVDLAERLAGRRS
jgi:hypothetical protein